MPALALDLPFTYTFSLFSFPLVGSEGRNRGAASYGFGCIHRVHIACWILHSAYLQAQQAFHPSFVCFATCLNLAAFCCSCFRPPAASLVSGICAYVLDYDGRTGQQDGGVMQEAVGALFVYFVQLL
ncbi:hypothetical protein BKA80DRAFT_274400 [Phyllosticta citrichinensis]